VGAKEREKRHVRTRKRMSLLYSLPLYDEAERAFITREL